MNTRSLSLKWVFLCLGIMTLMIVSTYTPAHAATTTADEPHPAVALQQTDNDDPATSTGEGQNDTGEQDSTNPINHDNPDSSVDKPDGTATDGRPDTSTDMVGEPDPTTPPTDAHEAPMPPSHDAEDVTHKNPDEGNDVRPHEPFPPVNTIFESITMPYQGVIERMPEAGLVGRWRIGNRIVQSTEETDFGATAPAPGQCVAIVYEISALPPVLLTMEASEDCPERPTFGIAYGAIERFPSQLKGIWKIDGETYLASEETWFAQPEVPFEVGACVQVVSIEQSGIKAALAIRTHPECEAPEPPEVVTGVLEAFPEDLLGDWVVNGVSYEVTRTTRLNRRFAEPYIGECVQIGYDPESESRTALWVRQERPDACDIPDNPYQTPVVTTTGTINERPGGSPFSNPFGTWVISGESYQAVTGTTILDWNYGRLRPGKCVEMTYYPELSAEFGGIYGGGMTNVIRFLKTIPFYHCRQQSEFRTYGIIQALPESEDLTGQWEIGDLTFNVTDTTVLRGEPFQVGMLVKAHFTRLENGELEAQLIAVKHRLRDIVDLHSRGKAFGIVDEVPEVRDGQRTGTWVVAGTPYTVTNLTRLRPNPATVEAGSCVRVTYYVAQESGRFATWIHALPAPACEEEGIRSYGFVEQMPPNGFVGSWTIGGEVYEATAETEFAEERAALAVGAFVKVVYEEEEGINVAQKIEAYVPPAAGDDEKTGTLQKGESNGKSVAATETWSIGGESYQVADATLLNQDDGELTDGEQVTVNSYRDDDGNNVATLVQRANEVSDATSTLYLPLVQR